MVVGAPFVIGPSMLEEVKKALLSIWPLVLEGLGLWLA